MESALLLFLLSLVEFRAFDPGVRESSSIHQQTVHVDDFWAFRAWRSSQSTAQAPHERGWVRRTCKVPSVAFHSRE